MAAQTSHFTVGPSHETPQRQPSATHSIGQAAFVRLVLRGERRSVSYAFHKEGMRSSVLIAEHTGVRRITATRTLKLIRESNFHSMNLEIIQSSPENMALAASRKGHGKHEELIG